MDTTGVGEAKQVQERAAKTWASRACDFLFIGAAILPAFPAYAGDPALAAIVCIALVIAGAVCGIGDPEAPHRLLESGRKSRPE